MQTIDWIQAAILGVLAVSVIVSSFFYIWHTKKLKDSVTAAIYSSLRRDEMELDKVMLYKSPELLRQCFIGSEYKDVDTNHYWIAQMVLNFFDNLCVQRKSIDKMAKGDWCKWERYILAVCACPIFAQVAKWGKGYYNEKLLEIVEKAQKGARNSSQS